MSTALISPTALEWAMGRSQLEPVIVAKKLSITVEKLQLWIEGSKKPTFKQAQKLAAILHIPFGYLFLPKPPEEQFELPDLRTLGDINKNNFSTNLRDTVSEAIRKQDWYHDYLKSEEYEPLSFIGKYNINTNPQVIASDITSLLKLTIEDRSKAKNWEDFLRLLIKRSEEAGIWVMRSGKVGNNTHRPLTTEEFRGFALCDSYAPLIFINGRDARAAQIFTLLHEIAHLWLGKSGISDLSLEIKSESIKNKIEIVCNQVAAEVLVPEKILLEQWNDRCSLVENTNKLSSFFKVSSIVIARRALDLKLTNADTFFNYYQIQKEEWANKKTKQKGGGDFYKNIPIANGRHFTEAVIKSVYSRTLLMRDGAHLLNISPSTLEKLAGKEVSS